MIDSLIIDENQNYTTNNNNKFLALEIVSSILISDPKNRLALIKKAEIYTLNKNYTHALDLYTKAVKLYPNDPQCFLYRGYLYSVYINDFDNALSDFNQSIKIDSLYRASYSRRGDLYFEHKEFHNAIADYTKVIEFGNEKPDQYQDRANCYIEIEDYNSALLDLSISIDLASDNPLYINNRGYFYKNYLDNYDLALADYARVLEISTDNWQTMRAFNGRANIFRLEEKLESCIEEYTKALEFTESAVVYKNRAVVYEELLDYKNALADYTKVIGLDQENSQRYIDRASCYILNNQHELAINDYNTAIRIKDDYYWYYYKRAYTNSVYLSKHEAAIKDYTKSIELDSTYYYNYSGRANAYRALGNIELSIIDINKAINIQPSSHIYNVLGNVYLFDLNDYDNALLSYQSAIMIDSTDIYPYINRINIYEELEEYEKILADLNTLISLEPNNAKNYINRADLLSDQSKFDLALADYAKAFDLSSNPDDKARLINNRALIYGDQGKKELEIEEYSKAIEITQEALWYANRGIAYQSLEQFDKALIDYNQMILLDPDNLETWNTRGLFFQEQLEYQNAINDFNQSLKIDKNNPYTHYYISDISYDIGEYEKAIKHSTKSIKIIKSSDVLSKNEKNEAISQLLSERALTYTSMGEIKKAINDCNESIEVDSTNTTTYYSLAYAYLRLDDYKSSFTTCDKGINNSNEGEEVLFYMIKGVIYSRMNEIDSAYALFHHALEINEFPHMPVLIYDMLAKLSIHTQNYDLAIGYCKKGIEDDKEDLNAYNNLSVIYKYQNKPFKSIYNLTKIIPQLLIDETKAPSKDDYLLKDYNENESTLSLTDLYIKRGKLWEIIKDDEEMCADYQKACDLGDCEMFNKNCK